ncbi:hypothetical protein E3Q01_02148 [Wallemia mellicola]|uniref:Transcription initiation factor IIE subunit alpha n=1 Tax=Wallemia mellicola TaxID=1708541 RepID=A0A4T0TKL4_9BASI|nr:hypothetical protein E3Q01_02148 [Wallemia mellicola]
MNNEHMNPTQDPQPTRRRYTRALSLGSSLNSANSEKRSNVLGIHFSPQVEDDDIHEVSQPHPHRRSGSPLKGPRPPPGASAAGLPSSRDFEGRHVFLFPLLAYSRVFRPEQALLSFHEQNPNKHQEHVQKRNEFEKAEAIVMERNPTNESEASVNFDAVNRKLGHMHIENQKNSDTGTPQMENSPKHPLRVTNPSASTTSLDATLGKQQKEEEIADEIGDENLKQEQVQEVEESHHSEQIKSDNKSELSHKSRKSDHSNRSKQTHKSNNDEQYSSVIPPRTSSKMGVDGAEQSFEEQKELPNDRDQIPVRKRSQTLPQNPRIQLQAPAMRVTQSTQPERSEGMVDKSKRSVSAQQQAVSSPSRHNTSSTRSPENASMLKYAHLDFLSKPPSSTEFPHAPKLNMRSGSNFSLNASSIGSNGVDIRSSRGMRGLAHAERGGGAVKFDVQKGGFVTPSNSSCSTQAGVIDPPSTRFDADAVTGKIGQVGQHNKKIQKARSQGDLLRQTTLLNTSTSPARTARELRAVLSGGSRFGSNSHQITLEQSRTRSRAEVDLVLDSEAVVEGGVLGGRMDVKLANDKVWWGNGKVRVVGFEDLQADETRHVFFHHDAPVDFYPPAGYGLPDDEGYYRGVNTKKGRRKDNRISLPFKIKLPIGGGAKGPLKSKSGFVRYIVIGSIHLKNHKSSDRSIAHFYRYVTIYPLLSPSSVLAPAPVPIMQTASKPLFLGGKGPINLTASVHRPHWVAGQRCYVMITIDNNSSKRVKSVSLSLNRTIIAYRPRPYASLMVGDDLDACQTTTNTKRIAEEKLEIGSKGTSGHVTAKGWFRGVDSGEQLEFSSSLQVPSDALTIPRTRLLEVNYTLRIGVAGSLSKGDVSVELPVKFINFLSIDPPPSAHPPTPMPMNSVSGVTPTDAELVKSAALERHKQDIERAKSPSNDVKTVDALRGTAKISPPALHAQSSVKAQTGNTVFNEGGPKISQMDIIDEALFNASVSRRGKGGKPPSPLPVDDMDTTAEQEQSSNNHDDSTMNETTQDMTEDSHMTDSQADGISEDEDDSGSEVSFDENDISEPAINVEPEEHNDGNEKKRPSSRPSLAESRRETLLNAIKDDDEDSASIDQNESNSNGEHEDIVEETPKLDIHSPTGDFHDAHDFEEEENEKQEASHAAPEDVKDEPEEVEIKVEEPKHDEPEIEPKGEPVSEQIKSEMEEPQQIHEEEELEESDEQEVEEHEKVDDDQSPPPVGLPQLAQDPLDHRSLAQSRASHLSGGDVMASMAYLSSPINDVEEPVQSVHQTARRPLPESPQSSSGKMTAHEQVNRNSPSVRSDEKSPSTRPEPKRTASEDPFSPTFMEQHQQKELPLSPSNKTPNSPSFWSPASKAAAAMPQLHPVKTDGISRNEEEAELETPTKVLNSTNEYSFDTFKRYAAAYTVPSPSAESDKSQPVSVKGRVAQFEQTGGGSNRSSINFEPSQLIKDRASSLNHKPSSSMHAAIANETDERRLKSLVQHVGRSFYESKYYIILDQLIRKEAWDGEIAGRIGLTVKDSSKLIAKLISDKLVFHYRRNEYQPPNPRPLLKTYYYIDYQQFIDNVKWRMWRIRKAIDDKLRNELDQKGYVCPGCQKTFTPLDVLHLEATTDTFICDTCNAPLKDNDESDGVKGSQDMMARLLMQCRHIIAGLKLTEDMTLPPFDIADWIGKNVKAITQPIKELEGEDDGLAVAGAGSSSGNNKSQVKVQIVADEHDAEQKKKLEQEAEERRTKNALPEWVLRSTISGEITAIGHRNQAIMERKSRDEGGTLHSQDDGYEAINMDQYYNDYYSNYNSKRSQSPGQDTSNKRIKQEDTETNNVTQQQDNNDSEEEDDDDFEQVA